MRKQKNICLYCNTLTTNKDGICITCAEKLQVVRKFLKVAKAIREATGLEEKKCECYHKFFATEYTLFGTQYFTTRTECWGTKNKDACKCNGNKSKCDFYPDKRSKAK